MKILSETTLKLMEAASAANEKLEESGGNLLALNEPYRTFVAVWTAQGIIDNGGMKYFFEDDFPHHPPYKIFVDSYQNIGADQAAIGLADAIASFPFENPEQHKNQRNQFMDMHFDERSGAVGIWDDSLCGDDTIFEKLWEFIESHRDAFPRETRSPGPWFKKIFEMINLDESQVLQVFLYAVVFEILLTVVALSGMEYFLMQCAYFLGLFLAAVSVPMLPYAILVAYRQLRQENYARMIPAVFATGAAVVLLTGATLILQIQRIMAGAPDF